MRTHMNRLTKLQSQIAKAHMGAHTAGKFDFLGDTLSDLITDKNTLIDILRKGKTVRKLDSEIRSRFVSITSQLMADGQLFGHKSGAYIKDYRRGMKMALDNLGIK